MNIAFLVGTVVAEPNLQETNDGRKVCRFRLRTPNGKGKDRQPRAPDYHHLVIWGKGPDDPHPENVHKIVKAGRVVAILGRITENRWVSRQDGQERFRTEIVVSNIEFINSPTPFQKEEEITDAIT